MRMPNISDLDKEQERIYLNAKTDGVILVTGPPGSGKTVMAYYRAILLMEKKIDVKFLMYNNVLAKYVQSGNKAITTKTLDSWAISWWQEAFDENIPKNPPTSKYSRYWPINWAGACEYAAANYKKEKSISALDWKHIIIDEGQDFPKDLYTLFNLLRGAINPNKPPALTVFADDNQQLNPSTNSTTREIRDALFLRNDKSSNFKLTKNYRNTKQIHHFSTYYAIYPVKCDEPDTDGSLPSVRIFEDDNSLFEVVKNICQTNASKEIGIVVPTTIRRVKQVYNKVSHRLNKDVVQMYSSVKSKELLANLKFDTPRVTIVHTKSVKGLEFDIVFYLDMQGIDVSDDKREQACKDLYVVASRARAELNLCFILDGDESKNQPLGLLPPVGKKLFRCDEMEKYQNYFGKIEVPQFPLEDGT